MLRNRWTLAIVAAALLLSLAAVNASMRPATAAPPAQVDTPTTTETTTPEITPTAILTVTATIPLTETLTPTTTVTTTETATPQETMTPTTTPTATAIPTPTTTPGPIIIEPFWSYAAKFVCGEQATGQVKAGEPSVKPGNYATEINIHNPHYRGPIEIRKKVLLLNQGAQIEPTPGTPQQGSFGPPVVLTDDSAIMDDCNSIWAMLNPGTPPTTPMPLMIGYLVVVSRAELNIVDVATAEVASADQNPISITLDEETVEGKYVLIPSTAFPQGVLPSGKTISERQP